jgi:hypothetical protein
MEESTMKEYYCAKRTENKASLPYKNNAQVLLLLADAAKNTYQEIWAGSAVLAAERFAKEEMFDNNESELSMRVEVLEATEGNQWFFDVDVVTKIESAVVEVVYEEKAQ